MNQVTNDRNGSSVLVIGAGILGLWQALLLSRGGWKVRLIDRSHKPFTESASQYAGAMIAPYCEAEKAPQLVRDYGLQAAQLWRDHFPGLVLRGSIVVAQPRDQTELRRFARMTTGHRTLDKAELAELEPDLSERFSTGLYFADEAHMTTPKALQALLGLVQAAGAETRFGENWSPGYDHTHDWAVDCRGFAARGELKALRGVRGERLLLRTRDVTLTRPVRLLHPRQSLYVVPWDDGTLMIGATVIESDDAGPVTVRSALELLGLAYSLHPGLGESEIVELTAGVRPTLPDNVPKVFVDLPNRTVRVNGAYRHGFLLAPVLGQVVCDVLSGAAPDHPLRVDL